MPLSALIFMLTAAALPDGMSVRAEIEPALIPFHRPAHYSVVVEVPAGTTVEMPSMMGRFDGLTASSGDKVQEILKDGRVRIVQPYTIEAIFPGWYSIEPATVTIDGVPYVIPSPVLSVRELTEAEQAAAEQFDAALPEFDTTVVAPFWKRGWFWALLAGSLLAGAAIGLALRRRAAMDLGPERTPWEIALARLEALQRRGLADKGDYDRYYVDLSSILRYYIEARFELHAPERTTDEFLKEITDVDVFNERQEAFLASFLKECDYVKFARKEPSAGAMRDHYDQVAAFIQETVPQEPQAPAEAA